MASALKEITHQDQKTFEGKPFPLTYGPSDPSITLEGFVSHISSHRKELEQQLLERGAILFRGFPTQSAEDFNEVLTKGFLDYQEFPYIGGAAPRRHVVGQIFTSNESPPSSVIPFHHEMAQVPVYPTRLFFYCDLAAQSGGETPILPSHEVFKRVNEKHPEFVKKLSEKGVRYTRVLPEEDDNNSAIGRSWKSTFNATTKEEAEEKCKAQGTSFEWLGNNMKTVTKVLTAVRSYPAKGELMMWFNSIVAAYTGWEDERNKPELAVTFGDGELLPREAVLDTAKIMDEVSVDLAWQKGDFVLIDNNQVMHARKSFVPPRKVYAALCK